MTGNFELWKEKVKERIHQVLLKHPGAMATKLNHAVRPYHVEWRAILEEMVQNGEVIRVVEVKGNRAYFKHYSCRDPNAPQQPELRIRDEEQEQEE